MDYHIELFDYARMTPVRKITTNTPFQFLVSVVRPDFALETSDSII